MAEEIGSPSFVWKRNTNCREIAHPINLLEEDEEHRGEFTRVLARFHRRA
jgi:hypothetical protein